MKNYFYFLIIALIFLFSGCSKDEPPKTDKKDVKDTATKVAENKTKEGSGAETKGDKPNTISEISYNIKDVESQLQYEGKIVGGAQWKDKNGHNVVIVTETNEKETKPKNGSDRMLSKYLYGYQFILKDNGETEELWKINDLIDKCQFDLTLNYIAKSITVTDLNNDGIGESTFLYRMSCRSDVSPSDLKLMMHEGKEKYAIRGTMIVKLPNEGPYGGDMKVDKSFDKAPKEFTDYAKGQFKKFQEEKFN
ncbi:MAG: hypothetical protein LWX07_03975 [Bacteroidetes bacterium]|nr:hypothetical protein [Bacteroidota bacterium]